MAITELAAIEAAYHVLQPLSPGARRRAVRWLSDALETEDDLTPPAVSGVPAGAAVETPPEPPAVGAAGSPGAPAAAGAGGAAGAASGAGAVSGAGAAVGTGRGSRSRRAGGRAATATRGDGSNGRTGTPPAPAPARAPAPAPAKSVRQRRRAGRPDNDRAYRRMPTADEVMAAYRSVGTVTGLAQHFDVPTHTVQGWARRLRSQGYQIGRGARDA